MILRILRANGRAERMQQIQWQCDSKIWCWLRRQINGDGDVHGEGEGESDSDGEGGRGWW